MRLRGIAHARSGDKGDIANIVVVARDPGYWPVLERFLDGDRVRSCFADTIHGDIRRYSVPHLYALNFVMTRALAGGVTLSLRLDGHGKGLAAQLLNMPLPEDWLSGGLRGVSQDNGSAPYVTSDVGGRLPNT